MLSRYTPMKMIKKPHSSETVLTPPEVLKPWNRIAEAIMVDVVNPT
jgi:hypothetical protein